MTNWISVEDRLPEANEKVLVVEKYGISCAYLWGGCEKPYFVDDTEMIEIDNVTHWMPLPPLPENNDA